MIFSLSTLSVLPPSVQPSFTPPSPLALVFQPLKVFITLTLRVAGADLDHFKNQLIQLQTI